MLEPTTVVEARVGQRIISAQQLAEHEGLVRWVVRQQWLGQLAFADALHEGRLGLWRALQRYDCSRGTRFSTYAVVVIKRAVWRAVSEHQQPMAIRRDQPASPTVELTDLAETVYRAQLQAELHRLVGTLPPRLRQVVVAHYGLADESPRTLAAIGQSLGVTRQRVQQLHVEALLWLAQPAHSLALRRLIGRSRRRDYQQSLARQYEAARARRASRRRPR